jgi:hypothetical protein
VLLRSERMEARGGDDPPAVPKHGIMATLVRDFWLFGNRWLVYRRVALVLRRCRRADVGCRGLRRSAQLRSQRRGFRRTDACCHGHVAWSGLVFDFGADSLVQQVRLAAAATMVPLE